MSIIIVTHGECRSGFNPSLTEKGVNSIFGIHCKIPKKIQHVVLGIGSRFNQTLEFLRCERFEGVETKTHTPIVGTTAHAQETKIGKVVYLADGQIVMEKDYLYPHQAHGFDPWQWLQSLPDDTLICTEEPFISSLGFQSPSRQFAQVYAADPTLKPAQVLKM